MSTAPVSSEQKNGWQLDLIALEVFSNWDTSTVL